MTEANWTSLLSDPLAEVTRKERRNLLIASVVGIHVGLLGLVPSKLSALGIDFTPPAQQQFVWLVAAVVSYFLVAFAVYASADWFAWWNKYKTYLIDAVHEIETWSQSDQERYDEIHNHVPQMLWLRRWSNPIAFTRVAFEFGVPVVAGVFSVSTLLSAKIGA